ncbi:nuclear transport factor 2 family protein [Homoserinibacter sp. YIM 151385]|uniref:nuclear transport factor 2 family protein n=1 Tax=Homoserinibacter sp. YIM 151385 TaxID=2985506 RepID=UPI0022F0E6E3|nr:nuclear transport factor 2 family protein [Homoserinibacter sp. YIM 151385]WBU39071.1 nuclear transport factor 2 family protein [Homoserinibacter sp. YIM 151385]
MAHQVLRDELLEVERAGWDALCEGGADEFYGRTMTRDALMTLADGSVMTRDEVVASLGSSPSWRRYEIEDPRVVPAGADAAVLLYRARAWRDDEEPAFTGAMSSTYVGVDGDWRLAHHQQTPQPGATS